MKKFEFPLEPIGSSCGEVPSEKLVHFFPNLAICAFAVRRIEPQKSDSDFAIVRKSDIRLCESAKPNIAKVRFRFCDCAKVRILPFCTFAYCIQYLFLILMAF